VVVHADTDYLDFYNSISRVVGGFSILADEQDIILPAFKGELYYDRRASASIPAAIIARVRRLDLQTGIPIPSWRQTPILATDKLQAAYPYLKHPAFVPHATDSSEIQVLERMRRREISASLTEEDWELYITRLKSENMAVWAKALSARALIGDGKIRWR
jgi:hypothetical protein